MENSVTPPVVDIVTNSSAVNHIFALRVSVNGSITTVVPVNSDAVGERVVDLTSHIAERFNAVLDIPGNNTAGTD